MNTIKATSNVTFTSISTILIPLGVGLVPTNVYAGLAFVIIGIASLIVREWFKVVE
ncbi:hypothetical protein M0R04_13265 [Candidatus Dojkabacteria bacterium]|jgi:hypothetical protein|nr:hypothetical protein [Candidatus Dojkabacteria bacterium]